MNQRCKNEDAEIKGSFRDPSGSLFIKGGVLYRRIAPAYQRHYERAENSGLYRSLISDGLLVPHQEVNADIAEAQGAYKVISPQKIPFISYPYEWCFSQLKDAALLTLEIQKKALGFGMTLKDASAFNIQFFGGRPILIDTLSFENYEEGLAWMGYRQFCQHFLAPLALMSYRDLRLNQLFRVFIDGIPLDLASSLLPLRTFLSPLTVSHIHLHAKGQKAFAAKTSMPSWRVSRRNLVALIDSLETAVRGFAPRGQRTEWANYYDKTNYSAEAFEEKSGLVAKFLEKVLPKTVWDLGGNTGEFSRLASSRGAETVSFDIDPAAVEKNYINVRSKREENLLPLVLDLGNPSPAIGWNNEERLSLQERGPADLVMALAFIHHLAISNNTPLKLIAESLSQLGNHLIIEFVPKTDSQVKRLLSTRKDIFPNYHQAAFEKEFGRYFDINIKQGITGSERSLYLMTKCHG